MHFENKLIPGKILKRYKRFLADIELENGEVVTAHTANTGSMTSCWAPGWKVLLSYHDNPKRKLKYSLELTHNGSTWICVNTSLPNKLAIEAIKKDVIKELVGYSDIKPEAKVGKSRIDILLSNSGLNPCYVEVKNVTLVDASGGALFPDAVTTRGQKHLEELIELVEDGTRAAMLYIINREDATTFSPAKEIDPRYSLLLEKAKEKGVEILAYQCKLSPEEVTLSHPIAVKL